MLAGSVFVNWAGYAFDLYQRFWWFDRVLHLTTIFAITLWLAIIVFIRALNHPARILGCILLASVGIAISALWEIAEWLFDHVASGNVIQGKTDTVLDLVMDSAGAAAAGIAAITRLGRAGHL